MCVSSVIVLTSVIIYLIWVLIKPRLWIRNKIIKKTKKYPEDSLYLKAMETIKEQNKVSIVLLQLSLKIGYERASSIIDKMEEEGLISPPNEEGKREVLIKN
jgi:DNA segregation ATPase FtsK/SpoIIIE-like protein